MLCEIREQRQSLKGFAETHFISKESRYTLVTKVSIVLMVSYILYKTEERQRYLNETRKEVDKTYIVVQPNKERKAGNLIWFHNSFYTV